MRHDIQGRTIDGQVYVAADDIARLLRTRADEYQALAAALPDDLDPEQWTTCCSYWTVIHELRDRADVLDLAAIEYVST